MKSKFGFYKTIILALASAVTLIAVSFAWFSTPESNEIGSLASYQLGDTVIKVSYYSQQSDSYVACTGDFDTSFDPAGGTANYKIIVTKTIDGAVNLNFKLNGLSTISDELKNNVYLDYSVVPLTDNGDGSTSEGTPILKTLDDYSDDKLLCNMASDTIFDTTLNTSGVKSYAIYYTIGLKTDASIGEVDDGYLGQLSISGTAVE